MYRVVCLTVLLALFCVAVVPNVATAERVRGHYIESRTCQVYTGPCFANGEIGLMGKNAIMAWHINEGGYQGVELADLNVVVVVRGTDTLGFHGLNDPKQLKSVILIDEKASDVQRAALVAFAKKHSGRAGQYVARIDTVPIEMSLDVDKLNGRLEAGDELKLVTRKVRPDDCICSNERAYYPPLVKVENVVPGVALEGEFTGRGLGSHWSTPGARSVFMATFAY